MTTNDLDTLPRPRRTSMMQLRSVAATWWPVPAMIVTAVIAQNVVLLSRYDVGGHAAEHLTGATAPFMAAAVVGILFWATPPARRQVDVLFAALAWFATTVAIMFGNLRVVDDLVDAGYSHTPTGSVPDIADHGLANAAPYWAVVAGVLLVVALRHRRHIGNRVTAGAMVAMLVPPWLIPGAGVVVVTIARCVTRARTPPER